MASASAGTLWQMLEYAQSTPGAMAGWIIALVVVITAVTLAATLIPVVIVFRRMKNPAVKDAVRATLQVTASSTPPHDAQYSNCSVVGVISAPGMTPTPVSRQVMAPVAKWPWPGMQLPVAAERGDPTRFKVLWNEVPTAADAARAQAENQARAMGGQDTAPPSWDGTSGAVISTSSVSVNGVPVSGASAAAVNDAIQAAMGGYASGIVPAVSALGEPGTAFVTDYLEQGPGAPVTFSVHVTPDGAAPPFDSTLTVTLAPTSPRRAAWCRVGAQLPVRILGGTPPSLQIDLARLS